MGRRLQCNVCLLSDGVLARVPPPDQQGSAELSEDSRTAEVMKRSDAQTDCDESSLELQNFQFFTQQLASR